MTAILKSWRVWPLYLLAVAVPVSVSAAGIATGLVVLTALGVFLFDRAARPRAVRPVALALGALLLVYFLATLLNTPHQWHKFQEELWIKLLLVAVPVLLAGRPEHAARVLKTVLVVGGLAAVFAVWQHFSGQDPIRDRSLMRTQFSHPTVVGFFSMHLSYAGQAMILLLMAAAHLVHGRPDRGTAAAAGLTALLGTALVWTFARSALFGTTAGLIVLVSFARGWRRWLGLSAVAAGLATGLLLPTVRIHLARLLESGQNVTRLNLWRSSLEGLIAEPWLGYGPGNFGEMIYRHMVPGYYDTVCHAHHDLLMHGVNAGVPGVLAALAILVTTVLIMVRALRRGSRWGWVFRGGIAVQAALTVAGLFQVYQTDDEVELLLYLVLGCCVGLAAQVTSGVPRATGD